MRSFLHPLQLALAVVDRVGIGLVRSACCRYGVHYRIPQGFLGWLSPRRECCNWCGTDVDHSAEETVEEVAADV